MAERFIYGSQTRNQKKPIIKINKLKMKRILQFLLVCVISANALFSQQPVAHWTFDDIRVERKVVEMVRGETYVPKEVFAYVEESVSGKENDLHGVYYKLVPGVVGNAALLDGYTAYLELEMDWGDDEDTWVGDIIPHITEDFSIETWIALGAYPKNHCPILDNKRDEAEGYYNGYSLELDANGRLMLKVATEGKYEIAMSNKRIPLNEWTHLATTYSREENRLAVYVNGELEAETIAADPFKPTARDWHITSMLIGKSRDAMRPYGVIRPEGTEKSYTFIDGILDELKLYDEVLSAKKIAQEYKNNMTSVEPELPERILPSGPQSPGTFRAVNTTLKYYEGWDAPWAIEDNADIVIQFDETDCKFVFWHGTSYIPSWVTENNIWFNNGFNEGWNDHGSCEPMSDKKAKYSTVKIVESNDARVVVLWRYALVDVLGTFAFEDPITGWGDWTNETYTIYPDIIGVREDILLSNAPNAAHEWQESMMVLAPGQRPSDVLNFEALSLANIKGESKTYSWEHETPPFLPPFPKEPIVQVVNTKSEFKPFSALRPQDNPGIDIYSGEIRRDVDVFPWWNHWPVAPRPTDGRYAMFTDRAAHASVSHWLWDAYKTTDRSMTKLMLNGMTEKPVEELIPLVKSWSNPAEIVLAEGNHSAAYTPEERAYTIVLNDDVKGLEFTLKGDDASPIVNPAFVIENWGNSELSLLVNGVVIERGKDLRYGLRESLDNRDLIVWLRLEAEKEVSFILEKD